MAFEETPCGRCELRERSAFTLEFDEERAAAVPTVGEVPFPEEFEMEEAVLPVSVMSEAIANLMALSSTTRDVVCWRFAGMRYREIARRLGVTVAGAELRHRRALNKWTALRALFTEKSEKQRRRKKHRRCGAN